MLLTSEGPEDQLRSAENSAEAQEVRGVQPLSVTATVTLRKGGKGFSVFKYSLLHHGSLDNNPLFPFCEIASLCVSITLQSPQLHSFADTHS